MLFAFTTVLGWSHYGTKAWEYLFGTKSTFFYKIVFVLMIMSGAVMTSSLAWDVSDTFNGLMMIPNLIGVLSLSALVFKITKNYVDRVIKKKDGIRPMLSNYEKGNTLIQRVLPFSNCPKIDPLQTSCPGSFFFSLGSKRLSNASTAASSAKYPGGSV